MSEEGSERRLIGRAELVGFPELGIDGVPARIDTGARTSALWATSTEEKDGTLQAVLFDKQSPHYTGKLMHFSEFEQVMVASSNGQAEERYKVQLLLAIGGKKIRARFTLADRATQVYPVLIGRNVIRGKFLVDVKQGEVLREAEKARSKQLQSKRAGPKAEEK